MSNLEILATFFTLICVALTVKRNIWCWPMGIIGVSAYFFVFYNHKLYADMGLQVVFLIQSIYGWYYWLNGNPEDDDNVPIRRLNLKEIGLTLASILTMLLVIGFLTDTYTDTDVAYLDAAVASTSLIANMLLARKILDNWVLWIIVDVFYVGLFYYKELYLTAGLYVIFFFMASAGFIEWRKKYQEQRLTVSSE